MSRTQRVTTEDCFTPEQRDFFRAYSRSNKHAYDHPMPAYGYAPLSQEKIDFNLLTMNLKEQESICGLQIQRMHRFCQHHKITRFDFDDPIHRDLLLPEIVALNKTEHLQYLSQRDYGRVMKMKSHIISGDHHDTESSESALAIGAGVTAFFTNRPAKLLSLAAKLVGISGKDAISKAEVDVFPEYWTTVESHLIPDTNFEPQAQAQVSVYRKTHLESEIHEQREAARSIHREIQRELSEENYFPQQFFATGSTYQQPTNPQQQAQFETQRLINLYTDRLNSALVNHPPVFYETTPKQNLERLAHVMSTSHSGFCTTAGRIARTLIGFLESDHKHAAAFIKHSVYQVQYEFLQENWDYSERSPADTYDTINKLMDAAQIPHKNRPFYQQQCLSVLSAIAKEEQSLPGVAHTIQFDDSKKHHALEFLKAKAKSENERFANISAEEKQNHQDAFSRSTQKMEKALDAKQKHLPIDGMNITPEQAATLAKIEKEQSELSERMKQKEHTQESLEGYRAGAQFVCMLGQITRNRTTQQLGTLATAGVFAYQSYTGFQAVFAAQAAASAAAISTAIANGATATAAAAAGATAASGAVSFGAMLGPYALAGMAVLTVVSMMMSNDDEQTEDPFRAQVMMALSMIMENLNHIRREMHERFNRIEEIEMQSRLLFLKGFEAVFFKLRDQMALTYYLNYGIERLAIQSDFMSSDLRLAFETLSKTPVMETVRTIMSGNTPRYLQEKINVVQYREYSSRLVQWLKETAVLHNGFNRIESDGEIIVQPDKIFKALAENVKPENGLGLLAGLAAHHFGDDIKKPTLINPAFFELGIVPYTTLLLEANPNIERNAASERAEIDSIADKAEAVMTFLNDIQISASLDSTDSRNLFSTLIQKYDATLNKVHLIIRNKLREQEIRFYQENGIEFSQNESLLGLHEKFDEACKRQSIDNFIESVANHAIEFNGVSAHYDNEVFNIAVQVRKNELGWQDLSKQFIQSVEPALRTVQYAEFLLGMQLNQIIINKKYNVDWHITRPGPHKGCDRTLGSHSFAYAMTLKSQKNQSLQIVQGNNVDSRLTFHAGKEIGGMANHMNLNPAWTVTLADTAESGKFLKETQWHVHQLTQPYRNHTVEFLEKDVEFSKTVDELESLALQLIAFMNLLGIDQDKYDEDGAGIIVRKSWLLETIGRIRNNNPEDSIANVHCLLLFIKNSELKLDHIAPLVCAVDIKKLPLYERMEAVMNRLHATKKAVVEKIQQTAFIKEEEKTRQPIYIEECDERKELKELKNSFEKSVLILEKRKLEKDVYEMKSKMDETNRMLGEMMRMFKSQQQPSVQQSTATGPVATPQPGH